MGGAAVGRLVSAVCAVLGFGLVLAAELLPWLTVSLSMAETDFPTGRAGRVTYGLDQLGSWELLLYNLGWTILLIFVAVTLGIPARWRGMTAAAGLGALAGQLAVLVGLASAVSHGGGIASRTAPSQLNSTLGTGLYSAFAAAALLAAALVAAGFPGWSGSLRRLAVGRQAASGEAAGESRPGEAPGDPLGITVTPGHAGPLNQPGRPAAADQGPGIDSIGGPADR